MPTHRWTVAAVAVLLAITGMAGCGRAAPLSIFVDDAADLVRGLPIIDDRLRVPPVPMAPIGRQQVPGFALAVEDASGTLLAPHVDGLSHDEARQVVSSACFVNDIVAVATAENEDAALAQALTSFGGHHTLRFRVADLAADMNRAETYGDLAAKVAVFAVCESVSLPRP